MLDQRLSNEQSNVGPTKYVAVGPTLNQRLGFGWRMVSVLAGTEPDEHIEDGYEKCLITGAVFGDLCLLPTTRSTTNVSSARC